MNPTLQTIHELRTIHGDFSDQAVSDQDLRTILDAAVRAANSSGRQAYSIVVVEDQAVMREVTGYAAARGLVFCADLTRWTDLARHLGYAWPNGGLQALVTASTDAVMAAQTAAIAARSLGLDSLFTNGIHRGDVRRVYRLLDLPEDQCFPVIALLLGYPRTGPERPPAQRKGRLNGPGVIHFGKYHRLTPAERDALVAQYDDPAQRLGLSDEWRQEGFDHYLEWFLARWAQCPRLDAGESPATPPPREAPPPAIQSVLARAGFLPAGPRRPD